MDSLLGQILLAVLRVRRQRQRFFPFFPLIALTMFLLLLAIGFLVGAAFLALSEIVSLSAAAALMAAGLFLLAVLLAAMLLRREPEESGDQALLTALLEQSAGKAPHLALMAGLLGIAVGYSPTLRRFLRSLTEEVFK